MVAVMEAGANALETNVLDELSIRAALSGADIQVKIDNGAVKLTGAVDCYAKKLLAEQAAAHVVGVREVVNELQILSDGVYGLRNIDLFNAATAIYRYHYVFSKRRINVTVDNGIVRINGRVSTVHERMEAERAIAALPNLRGIRNDLYVPCSPVKAEELRAAVLATLHRELGERAGRIAVEIDGNEVTLKGEAPSWAERAACVEAVSEILNVSAVHNQIAIRA
jgi:osmotically-inducible protein OsmY